MQGVEKSFWLSCETVIKQILALGLDSNLFLPHVLTVFHCLSNLVEIAWNASIAVVINWKVYLGEWLLG